MIPRTEQLLARSPLLADAIEKILADTRSPLAQAWQMARTDAVISRAVEEEKWLEELDRMTTQRALDREELLALERLREKKDKQRTDQILARNAKHREEELKLITNSLELDSKTGSVLIHTLANLAYHLMALRLTGQRLQQQQEAVQGWQDIQQQVTAAIIDHLATQSVQVVTIDNQGNEVIRDVSLALTPEQITELDERERIAAQHTPLQALERVPAVNEHIQQVAEAKLAAKEKIKPITLDDRVQAKQEAVDELKQNDQPMLRKVIRIVPTVMNNLKAQLSDEDYKNIKWPKPKRNAIQNIDDIVRDAIRAHELRRNIGLRQSIKEMNDKCIEAEIKHPQWTHEYNSELSIMETLIEELRHITSQSHNAEKQAHFANIYAEILHSLRADSSLSFQKTNRK